MPRKIEVLDVIELDDGLGLFGGRDVETDEKVTFHLRGSNAAQMAGLVTSGQVVQVEVPDA